MKRTKPTANSLVFIFKNAHVCVLRKPGLASYFLIFFFSAPLILNLCCHASSVDKSKLFIPSFRAYNPP